MMNFKKLSILCIMTASISACHHGHTEKSLQTTHFNTGSADVTAADKQALAATAETLKYNRFIAGNNIRIGEAPYCKVKVSGHTDTAGSDASNKALSDARAEAIKQELVKNGVPAYRIKTGAYGEELPAVPTKDGVHKKDNRRVDVTVVKSN